MMNGSNLQSKKKKWEMSDKERVQDLQRKLYLKAKQEKDLRFWVLYDKVRIPYMLREAYARVKENNGAPGVDGKTIEDIEKEGVEGLIAEIIKELETKTYKPMPVKRVMIPKANGKLRPLGIPTIKDRIIQMACKLVIEPIFEADFQDESYGFRPKRSAKDAVIRIKENLKEGKTQVYDADLSSYFDTIPHDKLMTLIARRISDKNILHLIKMWLKAPINEEGKISGGKKNKKGTPQGGVISPLLANIYLNELDKIVEKGKSMFKRMGVTIVRYADDFVLMGRGISREVIAYLKRILESMELKINLEKTRLVDSRGISFDFLGFTFRYDKDLYGRNKRYWNVKPSKKSEKQIRKNINEYLKESLHLSQEKLIKGLNSITRGWINYITIRGTSYPAAARRNLRWYLSNKLYRYANRKSQRKSKVYRANLFALAYY